MKSSCQYLIIDICFEVVCLSKQFYSYQANFVVAAGFQDACTSLSFQEYFRESPRNDFGQYIECNDEHIPFSCIAS
jgi:hypothetical protein